MAIVYKLKKDINLSKLEEIGYTLFNNDFTAIKVSKQDLNSGTVQYLMNCYYKNEKWKKDIYKKNKKRFQEEIGLKYDKQQIVMNEKFVEMITTWFIQIDKDEEKWIGLTSGDKYDSNVFYNQKILDTYCKEEVELLKKNDLIEEFYVEE